MKPERGHKHRTAVTIVSRVDDMLQARSHVDATPNMCSVIGFDNILAAIIERTVPDEEAGSSVSEVSLVILGNCVRENCQTRAVVSAMPDGAFGAYTRGEGLIDFRVGEGLSFSIVPAKPGEGSQVACEILLQVDAEAVLASDVPGMVGDVWCGNRTLLELGNGIAINPHIGVVRESQGPDHPWFFRDQAMT